MCNYGHRNGLCNRLLLLLVIQYNASVLAQTPTPHAVPFYEGPCDSCTITTTTTSLPTTTRTTTSTTNSTTTSTTTSTILITTTTLCYYQTDVVIIGGYGWVWAQYSWYYGWYGYFAQWGNYHQQVPVMNYSGPALGCWTQAIQNRNPDNLTHWGPYLPYPEYYWMYSDDSVAQYFLIKCFGYETARTLYSNQEYATSPLGYTCYTDENCNPLSSLSGRNFCDHLVVQYVCPVSLLWDSNTDSSLKTESFVNFPLDPNQPEKIYSWKASANAPLLVWDPKFSGKIELASQVFGAFTFGKRWNNGYEALGSLDKNNDGEVSGKELIGISLWFDHNNNGISDANEVVTAIEAKVKVLYYKGAIENQESKDLILKNGFLRENNEGLAEIGESVDWFATVYDSKDHIIRHLQSKVSDLNETKDQNLNSNSSFKHLSRVNPEDAYKPEYKLAKRIAGAWLWKVDDRAGKFSGSKEAPPEGILTFGGGKSGLNGHSIIVRQIKKNKDKAVAATNFYPLNGNKEMLSDGTISLKFTTYGNKGLKTFTEAFILPNSDHQMQGYSKVETGINNSKGEPITVDYSWSAEKL